MTPSSYDTISCFKLNEGVKFVSANKVLVAVFEAALFFRLSASLGLSPFCSLSSILDRPLMAFHCSAKSRRKRERKRDKERDRKTDVEREMDFIASQQS